MHTGATTGTRSGALALETRKPPKLTRQAAVSQKDKELVNTIPQNPQALTEEKRLEEWQAYLFRHRRAILAELNPAELWRQSEAIFAHGQCNSDWLPTVYQDCADLADLARVKALAQLLPNPPKGLEFTLNNTSAMMLAAAFKLGEYVEEMFGRGLYSGADPETKAEYVYLLQAITNELQARETAAQQ